MNGLVAAAGFAVLLLVGSTLGCAAAMLLALPLGGLRAANVIVGTGPSRSWWTSSGTLIRLGVLPFGTCVTPYSPAPTHRARRFRVFDALCTLGALVGGTLPLVLLPWGASDTAGVVSGVVLFGIFQVVRLFRRHWAGGPPRNGRWALGRRPYLSVAYRTPEENRAVALLEQGRVDEGLELARSLPMTGQLAYWVGCQLPVAGRVSEALSWLRIVNVATVDPMALVQYDNQLLYCMATLAERCQTDPGWTAEAWVCCERLRSRPRWRQSPTVSTTVAQFLVLAGQPEQALPLLKGKQAAKQADTHVTMARAYERLGRWTEAKEALARARSINPNELRLPAASDLVEQR